MSILSVLIVDGNGFAHQFNRVNPFTLFGTTLVERVKAFGKPAVIKVDSNGTHYLIQGGQPALVGSLNELYAICDEIEFDF